LRTGVKGILSKSLTVPEDASPIYDEKKISDSPSDISSAVLIMTASSLC